MLKDTRTFCNSSLIELKKPWWDDVFGRTALIPPHNDKNNLHHWQRVLSLPQWNDAGDNFECELDIPGLKHKDLSVTLNDSNKTLNVSGKTNRHSYEFKLSVPTEGDADKLDALLEDGVLKLILPKIERDKLSRVVHVKTKQP